MDKDSTGVTRSLLVPVALVVALLVVLALGALELYVEATCVEGRCHGVMVLLFGDAQPLSTTHVPIQGLTASLHYRDGRWVIAPISA
jgi:hypothetical protein